MRTFTLAGPAGSIDWNTGVVDSEGCYWIARDLEGWDGADISAVLQARLRSTGQFVTGASVLGRTLFVRDAYLLAPSEAARRSARDRLQAILLSSVEDDVPGLLTVHDVTADPLVTLDRRCQFLANQRPTVVDSPPTFGSVGGVGLGTSWPALVNWTIMAPDPLRYADALSSVSYASGVAVAAPNAGTAPASPVIVLNSPGSHVELLHAADGLTVTLDSGSMPGTLTIDLAARSVVDGSGTDRYDVVSSSPVQWWNLSPGANSITVTGATGTISWRSAWW